MNVPGLVVGVDVGGTFTDCLLLDSRTGRFSVAKVPSTPSDQSLGFMAGLDALGCDLAQTHALLRARAGFNINQLAAEYRALREWLPRLAVVGGCCGTDDRHVAAIGDACCHA